MVTPTTNVCNSDADRLDLVTCMGNYYSVIFWLEIAPKLFSEDQNSLGEDAPRPSYIAVCYNVHSTAKLLIHCTSTLSDHSNLLPTVTQVLSQ